MVYSRVLLESTCEGEHEYVRKKDVIGCGEGVLKAR